MCVIGGIFFPSPSNEGRSVWDRSVASIECRTATPRSELFLVRVDLEVILATFCEKEEGYFFFRVDEESKELHVKKVGLGKEVERREQQKEKFASPRITMWSSIRLRYVVQMSDSLTRR